MKEYLQKRQKAQKLSVGAGAGLTVLGHAIAIVLLSFNGVKYIWPPPEETTFLIDFTIEEEPFVPEYGKEPVAETVDLEKPVEVIQRSESPVVDNTPNETPETQPDDFGEVETPTPPVDTTKPKLNPKASFPGMGKKPSDASTAHAANEASDHFKDGQADGNSNNSLTTGKSNAHLLGRAVDGNLIEPKYDRQNNGVVVVTIWVDIYGNVQKAIPGAPGTTVDDATLFTEARNAAMRTHFTKVTNITADTPQLQEGTITYIFKLK